MKETVYIVEDDLDIGEVAQYLINNLGKETFVLNTVAAFNRQMNVLSPDLIILDARLPDGNGVSVCNQLKSDPRTKHIPVLLMSANENMLTDGASKADGVIRKPFQITDFESAVLQHLGTNRVASKSPFRNTGGPNDSAHTVR